jgi:hypothetical protein
LEKGKRVRSDTPLAKAAQDLEISELVSPTKHIRVDNGVERDEVIKDDIEVPKDEDDDDCSSKEDTSKVYSEKDVDSIQSSESKELKSVESGSIECKEQAKHGEVASDAEKPEEMCKKVLTWDDIDEADTTKAVVVTASAIKFGQTSGFGKRDY